LLQKYHGSHRTIFMGVVSAQPRWRQQQWSHNAWASGSSGPAYLVRAACSRSGARCTRAAGTGLPVRASPCCQPSPPHVHDCSLSFFCGCFQASSSSRTSLGCVVAAAAVWCAMCGAVAGACRPLSRGIAACSRRCDAVCVVAQSCGRAGHSQRTRQCMPLAARAATAAKAGQCCRGCVPALSPAIAACSRRCDVVCVVARSCGRAGHSQRTRQCMPLAAPAATAGRCCRGCVPASVASYRCMFTTL
jgi:hypothetical protein